MSASQIARYVAPGSIQGLLPGTASPTPALIFDWTKLWQHTALRFVIVNTGSNPLTVTPEAAYEDTGPAEVGAVAPAPFTVQPGQCYGDPYGIDEMRPFWRLWIVGDSTYRWGVLAIPR